MKLADISDMALRLATGKSAGRHDDPVRRDLLRRADEARDQGRYVAAADLYDEVIALGSARVELLLQSGHMHKEAKNFAAAKARYLEALAKDECNPEALLQLGHFSKVVGAPADAAYYYERAIAAKPDWEAAHAELRIVREALQTDRHREHVSHVLEVRKRIDDDLRSGPRGKGLIDPSLFPKALDELYITHQEAFVFTRNGNEQRTRWGQGLTVRGVDSLRGYLVSAVPYLFIEIFLDGELIYKHNLVPAPQRREKTNTAIRKYVYNAWIDFTNYPRGWHELVFRAVNVRGDVRDGTDWRRERIIIDDPLQTDAFVDCDGLIPPLDPASTLSVVEQINARPSIVHRASTRSFPGEIRSVAVIRADQLGDMVVSVPALRRLREILPDARITGLLSPANEGLARSLKVFDDIVILDFPDDPDQRQRVMTQEGQEKLARQLAPYKFDLAIDFPVAGVSYKLLPLTGAAVTMGYGGDGRKTFDLSLSTHDPKTNNDMMRHSARTRAMTETLALWLDSGASVIRRDDLSRDMLIDYGVHPSDDFIVLHSGSRIKFTQWPHYTELAREIVEKLDKQVVFMAESEAQRIELPQRFLDNGKIIYMNRALPFDHFDAFLSFCSVFVGNDSGPKHLAGLRGAKVVSIHSSRIGWSEWGQEHTGVVISRRVPCAGCSLHHDPEECAQDVACITKITVDEVFAEVAALAS